MARSRSLRADDRRFLAQVAASAFSNPFGDERLTHDERIIGPTGGAGRDDHLERLQAIVRERLDDLARRGIRRLADVADEDRDVFLGAALFDVYYRVYRDFDQHIVEQMRSPDEPLSLKFGRATLGLLAERGFEGDSARRYLAILFQIRRAYFFIDHGLVGTSPSMKELRRQLWESVFTHDLLWYDRYLMDRMEDFSTLLLGETGTGKGTAAAALGRSGPIPFDERKQRFTESFARSFIAINLSQYPEMLIESELFGHRKGAFTGAVEDHDGVLSLCSPHGSIFLDEIGDVSVTVQIKLLQVLQEREFAPVGSHARKRFRGRVIAATNRPVAELRGKGAFRDDFYYRLCSQTILVPPLRQRLEEDPGELDALLAHTIERLTGSRDGAILSRVTDGLRERVPADYPWSGNVRELEQAVRGFLLTRSWRPAAVAPPAASGLGAAVDRGDLTAHDLLARYCALLHDKLGSIAEVARRVELDWRTVKKHIEDGA